MLQKLLRQLLNGYKPAKVGTRRPAARRATPGLELLEERCLLSTAVAIVTNPISRTLDAGLTATFTAAATGNPTPTVQWEMSPAGSNTFTALSAGSPFSGVTTAKLTVTGITAALNGDQFEAVFSNGVSPTPTLATTPATLTVLPAPTIGNLTQTVWTTKFAGFSGSLAISGGAGPYTIVGDSGLPTGLTAYISGSTIRFSGTPTVAQAFSGETIAIKDALGVEASKTFSITINNPPTISHMSNNNWTQGFAAFIGAMTISGGSGPFAIVSSGNLPPGVTPVIRGDLIEFTGAPSVATNFGNCNVTIRDAAGATAKKIFVIDVEPALILGNPTLSQWTVGQSGFTGSLHIGGGTGAVTLAGSSGLPTGLTAQISGRTIDFAGTPTAVGTFASGHVTVKDSDGATFTATFSITINPAPTLSTLALTAWTGSETGFPGTITITGGTGPYSIASYGSLAFTPEVRGNEIDFWGSAASQTLLDGFITIRDKAGATVTEVIPSFRLNIQPVANNLTISQWTAGQPSFTGTITVSYGTAPFTITDARSLPTGLTAVVYGDLISFYGTPTAARTFDSGEITVQDSGGAKVTIPVNITINPALAITTTSLPALVAGANYSTTIKSTGGTGADTFTRTSGTLPPGLTLDSHGKISGVSSATTAYTFTVTVTDSIGAHASETYTIAAGTAIAVGNLTPAQWTAFRPGYKGALTLSGGVGTYTLTSVTGLPTGLSASLSGATVTIAGTPTAVGTFATGSITIASDGISTTAPFTITINPALTLGALSATAWTGDIEGFPGVIAIKGGTGPYTISKFSGIPFTPVVGTNSIVFASTAGTGVYANGSITVADATGATVTEKLAPITINPQAYITHMSVNNWTTGLPNFPGVLTIVGGTGPFIINFAENLPPGLTPVVSGATIGFKGTPNSPGQYDNCIITIQDAAGVLASRTFLIALAPAVAIVNSHLPAWQSGVFYSATLNATGGTGTDTFTLTGGALPPGLKLKANGTISGVATAIGTFTFTVTVTDSLGDAFSEAFTL